MLVGLGQEWDQGLGSGSAWGLESEQRRDQGAGGCSCAEQRARCTAARGDGCSVGERKEGTCFMYFQNLQKGLLGFFSGTKPEKDHIPE